MKRDQGIGVGLAALVLATMVLSSGCMAFAVLDQPPVAKFTVTPDPDQSVTGIRVGDLVTLDASASSDPQGYDLTYQWDLRVPNGSASRLSSRTGRVVSFYPDDTVSFAISLTVTARVQTGISGTRLLNVDKKDTTKAPLVIQPDENGTVEPWGFHPLVADEPLAIKALPNRGFKFSGWTVNPPGSAVFTDSTKASASVSVPLVTSTRLTVTANFVATAPPPRFLAWTKVAPNDLVTIEGDTGTTTTLSTGPSAGQMVVLVRNSAGVLYGIGSLLVPTGTNLYKINPLTGESTDLAVAFRDSTDNGITVAAAAFCDGQLYLTDSSGSKLYTANLTTGQVNFVGSTGPRLQSLAFNPTTGLYGTDGTQLYRVSLLGALTTVGPTKLTSLTSLTFTNDGRLFGIDKGNSDTIYSVDTTTGQATPLVKLSVGLLSLLAGS